MNMEIARQDFTTVVCHRAISINKLMTLITTSLFVITLFNASLHSSSVSTIDLHSDLIHHSTMCYTRNQLLDLRVPVHAKLNHDVWANITSLGLRAKPPTRRGRRGGKRHPRQIQQSHNQLSNSNSHTQTHDHPMPIPIISSCDRNTTKRHDQSGRNITNLKAIHRSDPFSNLTVHSWNAQSLRNKTTTLVEHVKDHDVDIMFITETKLSEDDRVVIGECTLPGYEFLNFPRQNIRIRQAGGIGVLFKKSLNLLPTPPSSSTYVNFEHCIVTMRNCFQFIPIYRTPRSKVNGLTMSGFLEEIELFLDEICVTPHKLLLVGDFNIHMDIPTDSDTKKFNEILANTGLCQSVVGPTHKAGHTLDLLISRDSDDHLIHAVAVDPLFHSDHNIVTCTVQCAKPPPLKVTTTSREYGKMDHERLTSLLKDRLAELSLDEDPNALVESYETITSSVLDEVCPLVTKTRTVKPKLPWYNQTIHEERRIRRRLERRWKKTRTVLK